MSEKLSKQELEERIAEEYTLGTYIFDEEKQCFIGDAEIELYISKVEDDKYKSVCYYFDGYEVWDEEGDESFYEGTEEEAKQKAIDDFNNGEPFMGYPVYYTNISCHLYENE